MRVPPEVHGVEFFTVHDLRGRRVRLAIGVADSGMVALALLEEGQPLDDDLAVVAGLAPAEVPALQRRLGEAGTAAAELPQD